MWFGSSAVRSRMLAKAVRGSLTPYGSFVAWTIGAPRCLVAGHYHRYPTPHHHRTTQPHPPHHTTTYLPARAPTPHLLPLPLTQDNVVRTVLILASLYRWVSLFCRQTNDDRSRDCRALPVCVLRGPNHTLNTAACLTRTDTLRSTYLHYDHAFYMTRVTPSSCAYHPLPHMPLPERQRFTTCLPATATPSDSATTSP